MASVERHGKGWRAVYAGPKGERVREVLPARTKAEARELAAKLDRRAWLQRHGLEVTADDLTGTLAELCRWWLDNRCPIASRDGERLRLQKHVMGVAVGTLPLSQVRTAVIEDLLHRLERSGAAPGSLNKVRALLHTVFARAKKAGHWVGENPVSATERRKVPKRIYQTLTPEQLAAMLEQVPEDWRPLFACGPALGLRKGELFALRKTDVDLTRGTLTVARSHNRNTTKGGDPAVLPIPAPLRPWIEHQIEHAPGPLLFPAPDGSQRKREADPQKILRHALARAGIVEGYNHRCRWCAYSVHAADNLPRYCPTCVKRTDGRGNTLVPPRGRLLWPKAIHVAMRFHDLRHGFATELLRQGVDVHRVQRLMRHSDVRVTTGTYGHLVVEDLRAAVDAHTPLRSPPKLAAAEKEPEIRAAVGFSAPYEPQGSLKTASAENRDRLERSGLTAESAAWAQQVSNLRPLPCE
jgi:integrase